MKSVDNAAVFRMVYAEQEDRDVKRETSLHLEGATLQIAAPLVDRLPDSVMSPDQMVVVIMNNLRISGMMPIDHVSYWGMVEAIPIALDAPLQPPDSPLFMRDVVSVMEQLQDNDMRPDELEQLLVQLRAPRLYVHVYTCDIDRRFLRDRVSDELFGALMKMCARNKEIVQLNDICSGL